jgi:hypothetical protein
MDALKLLSNSAEFRQQFGDSYLQGLEERANMLTQAYNDAGWQGSVTAGVEGGRFAAELVGVLTAVRGGAQLAIKLPTAAKKLVNAVAEIPASGSKAGQLGAIGDIGKLGATGPKVPSKLQPFTNPPQGPVIPSDWVSSPGRTTGSTIYYPPGTDPSAPGSTYIRLMPSGSTHVPGLENGYWISVKNGQPINPATGGTGTRYACAITAKYDSS